MFIEVLSSPSDIKIIYQKKDVNRKFHFSLFFLDERLTTITTTASSYSPLLRFPEDMHRLRAFSGLPLFSDSGDSGCSLRLSVVLMSSRRYM